MAANLAKAGHDVARLRSRRGRARPRRGARLQRAPPPPRRRCKDAEAVITMLPAGKHVRDVYRDQRDRQGAQDRDPDRLLDDRRRHRQDDRRPKPRPPATRWSTRRSRAASPRPRPGSLTFMVGGTDEAFERARPFLETMGKAVIHAGGPGAGQAAKICNNMLLGASMVATCEAFVMAREARPRPADLLRHLVQGVGPVLVDDHLLPGPRRRPGNARRPRL